MLITINNTGKKIYFRGSEPKFPLFRMKLVSRYSNNGILNNENVNIGSKYFNLTLSDNQEDWYSFSVSWNNANLDINDLGGYYDAYFEYSAASPISWVQFDKRLVKVVNNWTGDPIEYLSDNENNIQFINYEDA